MIWLLNYFSASTEDATLDPQHRGDSNSDPQSTMLPRLDAVLKELEFKYMSQFDDNK